MENFLLDNIEEKAANSQLLSYRNLYLVNKRSAVKKWLYGILITLIVVAFLPWTQNIRAKGAVTTLRQEQRPQELNTIIAGKVVKWHVKEGDFVKAGDTLLQLGEVKVEYFDPQLLERTRQQITAKQLANQGYASKAQTAAVQMDALIEGRKLKLNQLDNKIKQQYLKLQSDSMDLSAVNNEYSVSKRQIDAAKLMLDSGVISLTDFERRKVTFQNSQAKRIGSESKFLQSKQELNNLFIEKNSTVQEYTDKISKAEGERFSSLSNIASGEADVSKLENSYSNYDIRNQLYYIRAPQSGQITKAKKAGLGEMLKEGEMIVEIVPTDVQHAIELYILPMDLPLISKGQKVRFIFDGFPAIVFSGWPNSSYGTFGGVVSAIETSVSTNGKFRILVTEDPKEKAWPKQLSIGGGANGIALLKDVSIWYELWRNINGFPPEYYQSEYAKENKEKK
ncbi:MAG TPA: HlyD family efflux transporter periplasmic adaptor subunit [Sediminibacterium sp.]|jgi:multidrug efflux pump subunit AcrA (membrane-fusion protein)|nr:MAG: biotin attachment protein [Thiotrichales bacterium 35-46-9]OZA62000.1 MAG: biotin attachment protein [Sphingobacteriia bacterium 39-39-8]HQR92075.1 HlyD family efflux transporter periplasmic adaptor subunit [Sediminibacterium sp.]HQS56682.1 HlyD family efflux transporter periplasmic adaptor subunit [Sediminibacterium sp.]